MKTYKVYGESEREHVLLLSHDLMDFLEADMAKDLSLNALDIVDQEARIKITIQLKIEEA